MSTIISPKPRMAPLSGRESATDLLVSPSPIFVHPLKRLLSPISLPDSCMRSQALSQPPRSSRRRPKPTSHTIRRRRNASRIECRMDPLPHTFDQLPWIAALDSAPMHTDPWNIADLSLTTEPQPSDPSPTGPGPVRRRKTSLRSTPFTSDDNPSRDLCCTPPSLNAAISSQPAFQTPFHRFDPSTVRFHHLMPFSIDGS